MMACGVPDILYSFMKLKQISAKRWEVWIHGPGAVHALSIV